jgi:hypothetical protein
MSKSNGNLNVKLYHGYGHTHNLIVYGHVLMNKPRTRARYTNNAIENIIHLLRLFQVKPIGGGNSIHGMGRPAFTISF